MCGNATLTMVVSSTCRSVDDITAKVIINRSAGAIERGSTGATGAAALIRASGLRRTRRDQDAAGDAVEQPGLLRLAPPLREAAAIAVADDDQICADFFRDFRDVHERIAVHERAFRGYVVLAQPLHAFVEQRLRSALLAAHQLGGDAFRNSARHQVATDG